MGIGSVLAFGLLVWLGRGLTFFADEWEVIQDRPIGLDSFFRPFNEHWLGVTTLVYRAVFEVIGLGTYVPYLALLALLHVVVALLAYAVLRGLTVAPIAAGMAIVFLFFGSGFENLFWGMQIGFVGAIGLGLAAMLLLIETPNRRRIAGAGVLLTIAVATSGYGLLMVGLVGLRIVLDRSRWVALPAVVAPAVIWLGWYALLGRGGIATHGDPFTVARMVEIPGFILRGAGAAFGGAVGVGPFVGLVVALLIVAWTAEGIGRRRRAPIMALAALGSIVATYGLLALLRSQLEDVDASQYPRYTYLTGLFALLALGDLIGPGPHAREGRARLAVTAGLAAAFALSLTWNGRLIVAGREAFADRADLTRAFVELGLERPLPDGIDPSLTLILAPSPDRLPGILARYGSPLQDSLAADAVRPIPDEARQEALRRARNPPDWLLGQQTRMP